jgi:hypothetical protein
MHWKWELVFMSKFLVICGKTEKNHRSFSQGMWPLGQKLSSELPICEARVLNIWQTCSVKLCYKWTWQRVNLHIFSFLQILVFVLNLQNIDHKVSNVFQFEELYCDISFLILGSWFGNPAAWGNVFVFIATNQRQRILLCKQKIMVWLVKYITAVDVRN